MRICSDLGLKDAQDYAQKLKKAEKARELKQQVSCKYLFIWFFFLLFARLVHLLDTEKVDSYLANTAN